MSTLPDASLNYFAGSIAHFLAQDRLFLADQVVQALASGGGIYNFGLTTDSQVVSFLKFGLVTRGSDQVLVEIKEDAAYSAGAPWQFFNANRSLNNIFTPFTDTKINVTEDTPGLTIKRQTLLGSTDKKITSEQETGLDLILKPLTSYILSFTNQDATDSVDLDIQLTVGAGK